MTDTPLPFEKEINDILIRYKLAVRKAVAGDYSTLVADINAIKAALLAAHQAEMRRVIGEKNTAWTPVASVNPSGEIATVAYIENRLIEKQYRRAGIEPEEKRDE